MFLHLDTAETSNNKCTCLTDQIYCLHSSNNFLGKDSHFERKIQLVRAICPLKSNQNNPTEFTNEINTGISLKATLLLPPTKNQENQDMAGSRLTSYLDQIDESNDMTAKDWNSYSSKSSNAIMAEVVLDFSGSFDGWKNLMKPLVLGNDHFHHHPKLFTTFFRQDDERPPVTSSTAASFASSVSEPDVEDFLPHPPPPPFKQCQQ